MSTERGPFISLPQGKEPSGPEMVNVFFAPEISPDEKVVNLSDGAVVSFQREEPRPQTGYFAEYSSLERYCLRTGRALSETNGQASTQPIGHREAGDPLLHGNA